MATKFAASVIALALLVSRQTPGGKVCSLGGKTRVSLCLQKKNRSPECSMARVAEHAHYFCSCDFSKQFHDIMFL